MRYPLARWLLVLGVVLFSLWLGRNVQVREDALDLLPTGSLRDELTLLQEIGLVDRVFISLEADPAKKNDGPSLETALRQSVEGVSAALTGNPLFAGVVGRLPQGYEFVLSDRLQPYLPALLSSDDLAVLATRLSDEGLRRTMQDAFTLLNSPAGFALQENLRRDPFGIMPLYLQRLTGLRGELAVSLRDGFFFSSDGKQCLLWLKSKASLTDSAAAAQVEAAINQALGSGLAAGVRARVIGPLPHTLANARTIERDLKRLLPLAFGALVFLLLLFLRSWRALLVVAVPFLSAPVAVALLGRIFDGISIMALGFGIVLLGISVDFAVHIYLAMVHGRGSASERLRGVRLPVLMAGATTLSVFAVLLFSDVPSHRQMATLALCGVSLAMVFAWLLVPTLAGSREEKILLNGNKQGLNSSFSGGGKVALALWLLLLAAGAWTWPQLQYSGDLRQLEVGDAAIAADEEEFGRIWGRADEETFVVVEGVDLAQALDRNDQAHEFLMNQGVTAQSIANVLPGPTTQARNIAAWQDFRAQHAARLPARVERISTEFGFAPGAFTPFFQWLATEPTVMEPQVLLDGPLGPLFLSLLHLPDKEQGEGAPVRVVTLVSDTPENSDGLVKLSAEVAGVRVLSPSNWRLQVEKLLRRDIVRLSLAAGVLIVLLAFLMFRDIRAAIGALTPVLSALSAMAVFDYCTTRDLNLMHLLMGIMVIGVSVDYGIFAVCAARGRIERSAFLGVTICALSTLTGFGVLALARHPSLHALGATVLVGIGAAWPTALLVAPVVAGRGRSRGGKL